MAFLSRIFGYKNHQPAPATPAHPLTSVNAQKRVKPIDAVTEGLKGVDLAKMLAFKPVYHAVNWAEEFGTLPPELSNLGKAAKTGKNLCSVVEIPSKGLKVLRSVKALAHAESGQTAKAVKQVVLDGTGLMSPVYDGIEELNKQKVLDLSATTMRGLKTANYSALVVGMGNSTYETLKKLSIDNITNPQIKFHLFELAKCVSYVALGVIGLVGLAIGAFPLALLAASTSALIFSITGYFYKTIKGPEKVAIPATPAPAAASQSAPAQKIK